MLHSRMLKRSLWYFIQMHYNLIRLGALLQIYASIIIIIADHVHRVKH